MKKIILLVLVLVLAGAYWFSMQKVGGPKPAGQKSATLNSNITLFGGIGIAKDGNNSYLVDQNGMTLYANLQDQNRSSTAKPACNAECEKLWVPYLYDGKSGGIATGSKDPFLSKFNLYTRADGQKQYSIGTQPLYRYLFDRKQGDMEGGKGILNWEIVKP